MKRIDLIRHLESHGCQFMREGRQHSLYINRQTRKSAAVPSSRDSPGNSSKHLPRSWNSAAVLKRLACVPSTSRRITPFAMLSIMRQQELIDRIKKLPPHDRVTDVAEFVES
jgi:mRNA interferase HicA